MPPPPNDNFADAIEITVPSLVVGTTVDATFEITGDNFDGSTEQDYAQKSVWYRLSVTEAGYLRVAARGIGGFRPYGELFRSDSSDTDPPANWEDTTTVAPWFEAGPGGALLATKLPLPPGEYWIYVADWDFDDGEGAFELAFSWAPITANDLEFQGRSTPSTPGGEMELPFFVDDPFGVIYMRAGGDKISGQPVPVLFDIRKKGETPLHDDLENRLVITNPSAICPDGYPDGTFTNTGGTPEDGEPAHAGFPARRSVWYEWQPAAGVPYDIWVEATSDDFVLAVYEYTIDVADLVEIASDDNSGPDIQPKVTVTTDGNPILIVVDSKENGGDFVLRAELADTIPRPPNDDFENAATLGGVSGTVTGSLVGATCQCGTPVFQQPVFPSGFQPLPPIGGDVWYTFTPTGSDYTLTWESANPVRITVYTGSSLQTLAVHTSFSGDGMATDDAASVSFAVTPGTQYFVRVEQADDEQTTVEFEWEVLTPGPGAGDDHDDAPDIVVPPGGGGAGYDYDLGGAGQQPNEPLDTPGELIRSVWRRFTPTHDCTYWTRYDNELALDPQPTGERLDFWRDGTLGALDLLPCQNGFINRGDGTKQWFGVRMKKDETYLIRHSSPNTVPPSSGTMVVDVEYEMDEPWTDEDGWDSETGASTYVDGVLTFSELAYRTINPWVGGRSSGHGAWISFDMRIESEFSPTAGDGPVLGRASGPSIYYPSPGNRIGVLRLHRHYPDGTGSFIREFAVFGDHWGNTWFEVWNATGGGNSIDTRLLGPFAIPNDETEGGEWIPVDITPMGVFIHGRLVASGDWCSYTTDIDWGGHRWPNPDSIWDNTGPAPSDPPVGPPETWTLQLRRMRVTDRRVSGPRLFENETVTPTPQNMIVEFDTRIGGDAGVVPSYSPLGFFTGRTSTGGFISGFDPADHHAPNPGTRTWDTLHIHDQSRNWIVTHPDNPQRHGGQWFYFSEFPIGTGNELCIHSYPKYTGTTFGYFHDVCRLVIDTSGDLWIYPHRNFRSRDPQTIPSFNQGWIYDPNNKKTRIGKLELDTWYWIETLVDTTWPWDMRMRVAVNEVECHPYYDGILNQSMGNVAKARYEGSVYPGDFNQQEFGSFSGTPNASGQDQTYTGNIDMYLGPWFVGRGGLTAYTLRNFLTGFDLEEPLPLPGIGAHAGGMVPFTRDGVHKVLDIDDATPFDLDGPLDDPLFTYAGVRLYKGSKSVEASYNHDMSLGVLGYEESNWGAQPSLPPVIVTDTSGPIGYESEPAVEIGHDPSGPGGDDHSNFGDNLAYVYVGNRPPGAGGVDGGGVREGGNPDDDGGNHFIVFFYARKVGPGSPIMDAFYGIRGDVADGPSWTFNDENWKFIWGMSYPNYDLTGGLDAEGLWKYANMPTGTAIRLKHVRIFQNAHVYPRFKTTIDNGATSTWIEHADDPVVSFIHDDPLEDTDLGVFLDNVCSFERFARTAFRLPGLLGPVPTGISMGDYRHRRYVEVKPPTEPDLEDTNLQISSLRILVRAAGYGQFGPFGDISTARANGTLKMRMVGGTHRLIVDDFAVTSVDTPWRSQVLPMTPMGFGWQTDRVSEIAIRMGYHFNYDDMSLNDSYGYRVNQSGGAVCKALACEVLAKVQPGPPICGKGMSWKSRLTRRV